MFFVFLVSIYSKAYSFIRIGFFVSNLYKTKIFLKFFS